MSKSWRLQRTEQCAKCPWRKAVNPHMIPNGYSEDKHAALKCTIATPTDIASLFSGELHVMACHEEHSAHCIGWLMNQVGRGNNIAMRLKMRSCANASEIKMAGEQHERFEDTLPD